MIDRENSTAVNEIESGDPPVDTPPRIPKLELQPEPRPGESRRYEMDELLRYHDRNFISQLYLAIQKRPPSEEELTRGLDDLRSGRRTKIELIGSMTEAPSGAGPRAEVSGLTSPAWRRVMQWPVVGYLVQMFAGLARLPRLIKDQQKFEAYTFGQQQEIADYLNQVLAPKIVSQEDSLAAMANLSVTVTDAVDTVTMLSDSLIELSVQHAELQSTLQAQLGQLQAAQAHQAEIEIELHTQLAQAQQQLVDAEGQIGQTAAQIAQTRTQLQQIQTDQAQQAGTEQQLQAGLANLAVSQTSQQQAIEELQRLVQDSQRRQNLTADAQQEFLIQEQRVIVETQKVVLGDLQTQIGELLAQQKQKNQELAAEMKRLRALIQPAEAGAVERETRKQAS